jgi:AraC-like DNA-binding protein
MANTQPHRVRSITQYHQLRGLPGPEHPLISVINFDDLEQLEGSPTSLVLDYYSIAVKKHFGPELKYHYGQQSYDFDGGTMFFIAPGQVFSVEAAHGYRLNGWMLLVHPDFLWNTPLAKTIKQYEYFSYSVHEALFLSEKEEATITGMMQSIQQEYKANIDKFTQSLIIAQIEVLLTYADRFYHRQFITRKIANHAILARLEGLLDGYFSSDALPQNGLPTVQHVADSLNVSPNYLSGMLKTLTGQSTQQHIHDRLIAKAKEQLSTTALSVSEIAYALGFEHSQSFSKLFKSKAGMSPLEFRQSFN